MKFDLNLLKFINRIQLNIKRKIERISIHRAECSYIVLQGGIDEYIGFVSYDSAYANAKKTGMKPEICGHCNPDL